METSAARLTVEITNLSQVGGTLRIALYKPGTKFGRAKPDFYKNIIVGQPGDQKVEFEVEPGTYALAVYHDLNNNNRLDKNLLGYPREPFGFSNNYRPSVAAPTFGDCAFPLPEQGGAVSIRLLR